jgi:type IV secretory pathway VirB10-like protein
VPRLSLATPHEKMTVAPKAGLNIKVTAEGPVKPGVKPPVVKPGKPGAVLRKRAALSPIVKAGIGFVVVAIAIGGVFSYRIFFPPPPPPIQIHVLPPKPVISQEVRDAMAAAAAKKEEDRKLAEQKAAAAKAEADKAKADAAAADAPPADTAETVMAETKITNEVQVNNNRIYAAPAASAAFRTFVASADIGGVFQGSPPRALINGSIVRAGSVVEGSLGIEFDRIDAAKKVIFFKDSSGAEVSKPY